MNLFEWRPGNNSISLNKYDIEHEKIKLEIDVPFFGTVQTCHASAYYYSCDETSIITCLSISLLSQQIHTVSVLSNGFFRNDSCPRNIVTALYIVSMSLDVGAVFGYCILLCLINSVRKGYINNCWYKFSLY